MTDTAPFEGVEKRLVIQFAPEVVDLSSDTLSTPTTTGKIRSPLYMSQDEWQTILDHANCTIVSVKELGDHKVYLLSESTLTVWKYGFLMKTCGRTTPFLALDQLLAPLRKAIEDASDKDQHLAFSSQSLHESAVPGAADAEPNVLRSVGDGVNWMTYSRLEFIHPDYQIYPHQSFPQEVDFLTNHVFGPPADGDTSLVQCRELPAGANTLYVAFVSNGRAVHTPYNMQEILMTGVDPHCVKNLTGYDNQSERLAADPTKAAPPNYMQDNLTNLHESQLDEFWFDPCGYSANALMRHRSVTANEAKEDTQDWVDYFSCHISPEPETSYASLELGSRTSGFPSATCGGFDLQSLVPHFAPSKLQITQVCVGERVHYKPETAPEDDAASYTTTASSSAEDFVRQQPPPSLQIGYDQDCLSIRFIKGSVECVVSHTGWQSG